jgi:hypothetical protein
MDMRKQEFEDFTRETGIAVKVLPCPESAWEQLAQVPEHVADHEAEEDEAGQDHHHLAAESEA